MGRFTAVYFDCIEKATGAIFVLSVWRKRGYARPWISMVAAYAIALQALLGAVLVSQAAAAGSDPFVICYASQDGTPADHGKSQTHETCALCTLAKGSHAILGGDYAVGAIDLVFSVVRDSRAVEQVAGYDSPTGQYQRGPPATA